MSVGKCGHNECEANATHEQIENPGNDLKPMERIRPAIDSNEILSILSILWLFGRNVYLVFK